MRVHIRATELIVQPNPNGELSNLTEDAFSIPANSTILDGWVNVSTGSNGDGGSGTHWNANSPTLNFSHGTFSDSSISVFDHELTLDVNHTVGRLDDLRTLSMRFQQYSPGGTADVWRMAEPSQFNGAFAMNYSARQAAGGLIPSLASDGSLIAATLPEDSVPAGTHAWLSSPKSHSKCSQSMDIEFQSLLSPAPHQQQDWLIWCMARGVSLDAGQSWHYIEPIGGYNWNISDTGSKWWGGFGVFGGPNASGWVNTSFDISHLHSINHSSLLHRFVLWTDPTGMVDRPGWYVDDYSFQ